MTFYAIAEIQSVFCNCKNRPLIKIRVLRRIFY